MKNASIHRLYFLPSLLALALVGAIGYSYFGTSPGLYWIMACTLGGFGGAYFFIYYYRIIPLQIQLATTHQNFPTLHQRDVQLSQTILEHSPDPILILTAQAEIALMNTACASLFGYGESEMLGQNIDSFFPPASQNELSASIGHRIESKDVKLYRVPQKLEGIHKGGEKISLELTITPLQSHEQNLFIATLHSAAQPIEQGARLKRPLNLLKLVDTVFTLTEKKEEIFVILKELMNVLVQELGFDCGHLLKLEPKSKALLESTRTFCFSAPLEKGEAHTIHEIKEILGDALIARGLESAGQAMARGLPAWTMDMSNPVTGSTRYTKLSQQNFKTCCAIPFGIGNTVEYVMELFSQKPMDLSTTLAQAFSNIQHIISITAQCQKMEKEISKKDVIIRKAYNSRSAFFNRISHDIRTPVNGILGFVNLLLDSSLTQAQEKYARTIKSSAEDLMMLLRDILDLALLESNNFSVQKIEFNLEEIFLNLEQQFKPKAADKNISFTLSQATELPPYIIGDPARLHQVLYNIIENAIAYTSFGNVHVGYVFCEEETSVKIQFTISDTGPGIDNSLVRKYMDLHINELGTDSDQAPISADSSPKEKIAQGIGLELSVLLVQAMGGTLYIDSGPGRGTTVSITLPFEKFKHHGHRGISDLKRGTEISGKP